MGLQRFCFSVKSINFLCRNILIIEIFISINLKFDIFVEKMCSFVLRIDKMQKNANVKLGLVYYKKTKDK